MAKTQSKEKESPNDSLQSTPVTELSDIAYLLAIKNMQAITHDTETFLRNNHMVYTASVSSAMKKMIEGDDLKELDEVLDKIGSLLKNNEEYHKNMNAACIKMLTEVRELK